MVRRRLNRKVAFLGSIVFIVLCLVFILVVFQFNRDPQEFIKDAEIAKQTARQTEDVQLKEQYYDIAKRKYLSAFSKVRTNPERLEILFKMVDLYLEVNDWPYVLECWEEILRINPDNTKAHYGRLRYFYILGQSGVASIWPQVHKYASDFLTIAQQENILNSNMTEWKIPLLDKDETVSQSLGAFLYLARGRAAFEQANMGAVTNIDELLSQSIEDFEKAKSLEAGNVEVYLNLAKAVIAQGESEALKGREDARNQAQEKALEYLNEGIENSSENPRAYVNLYNFKLILARESDPELIEDNMHTLEAEYSIIKEKFPSNAEILAAVSQFYSKYSQYSNYELSRQSLDKAIKAGLEALNLDQNKAIYAINVTDLLYRRYSVFNNEPDLDKAIEIAKNALSYPDAQDKPGPRNNKRIRNKFLLNSFLANSYIEQIINPSTEIADSTKEQLLENAESAVHEIEMILAANEDPYVIKWKGMLDLAKGNKSEAIVKLNNAYEQLKSVLPAQPPWPMDLEFAQLSYTLAKIFKNTDEIGKVNEYLINAHYSGIEEIKPQARLDYVETILKFNRFSDAMQNIDAYEQYHNPDKRSKNLRVKTLIYANQFDKAETELAAMSKDDPDTINLKILLTESRIRQAQMSSAQDEIRNNPDIAENLTDEEIPAEIPSLTNGSNAEQIKQYVDNEISLLNDLLRIKPDEINISNVIKTCQNCIITNEIEQAKNLIKICLEHFPEDIALNVYSKVLNEPQPANISQDRYTKIEEDVLLSISDPVKRATHLGIFYRQIGQDEKAIDQLKQVLDAAAALDSNNKDQQYEQIKLALSHLFEMSLAAENWDLANNVLNIVREKNLDNSNGLFFEARVYAAKGDFKTALTKIDECLAVNPIFSMGYMLRSNINAALNDEHAYMEDIRKAANINPLDSTISKRYAIVLYYRNQNLGDNVTNGQYSELMDALEKAIALNQGDLELLDLYTNSIASTDPARAIAIRQDILSAVPTVENAIILGELATEAAMNAEKPDDIEGFFAIADSAFKQAISIDPNDRQVIFYYSQYLEARGLNDQARQLLEKSQDEILLSNYLFQQGNYEQAKNVLEQLYKKDSENADVLRGLMLVSQKLNDPEKVKKYSDELILIDNSPSNLVSQIRAYLTVGLTKEAEYKLQSLKEKYPDEPTVALLDSWLTFKQGDSKKALEKINIALQGNKNNPSAWQLRGEINLSLGNYDKAVSDLKTSKNISNDPAAGIMIAKVYIQDNNYNDAIVELKENINIAGCPAEARLLLESLYMQLGRETALKTFYNDTLDKFPDSVQWLNKAAAFYVKTKDYEKAEKLYQKSFQIRSALFNGNPQSEIDDGLFASAFDGYLQSLILGAGEAGTENWKPEKLQTVIEQSNKYLESSFAALAYLRIAEALIKLHDEDKAAQYCKLSLEKITENERYASEVLLRMYLILGYDEVIKYCKQILDKNPDSIPANYTMHNLKRLNNEYDEAVKYIDKCIELIGQDSPIRNDYIMKKDETLLAAYAYTSDNKYIDMAINDYESLLSEMPNNTQVLNNLAYILAESSQRLSDALEYSRKVLEEKPNEPGFLDTYAYVLYKNGKYNEADEAVEKALKKYIEQGQEQIPAEVYEHKGMIKEKLDKNEEAYIAYNRALELGSGYLSNDTYEKIKEAIERVSP